MTRKLEGKVAVVTGGSAGIGLAAAKRFAAEGAQVFISGRRQPELDAAVKEIGHQAGGGEGRCVEPRRSRAMFETVKAAKGRIDVLFANAGIYEFTPFGIITEAAYDKMFDINVKGVLFTVQQAAAADRRRRRDHPDRIDRRAPKASKPIPSTARPRQRSARLRAP